MNYDYTPMIILALIPEYFKNNQNFIGHQCTQPDRKMKMITTQCYRFRLIAQLPNRIYVKIHRIENMLLRLIEVL